MTDTPRCYENKQVTIRTLFRRPVACFGVYFREELVFRSYSGWCSASAAGHGPQRVTEVPAGCDIRPWRTRQLERNLNSAGVCSTPRYALGEGGSGHDTQRHSP